jgi:hypothetical protein
MNTYPKEDYRSQYLQHERKYLEDKIDEVCWEARNFYFDRDKRLRELGCKQEFSGCSEAQIRQLKRMVADLDDDQVSLITCLIKCAQVDGVINYIYNIKSTGNHKEEYEQYVNESAILLDSMNY